MTNMIQELLRRNASLHELIEIKMQKKYKDAIYCYVYATMNNIIRLNHL